MIWELIAYASVAVVVLAVTLLRAENKGYVSTRLQHKHYEGFIQITYPPSAILVAQLVESRALAATIVVLAMVGGLAGDTLAKSELMPETERHSQKEFVGKRNQ